VKRVVQEKMPDGVNDNGLTLTGFLFLHALFIEKGRLETTWTVLRKFGYDNDIKLRDDLLPTTFKRAPDQVTFSVEINCLFGYKRPFLKHITNNMISCKL
jgi:EF hand associated